ncbi:GNAT family N-acetyltransferase [Noviherbaspirillum massiliense]|uniref:GNAT family N-acetyltransferase n=1 Tax=Noviherbaspirillum massiliense TaxID=1465823 RepID=UPI000317E310|nr:GNAT family N-acetyltransferase [Noviherbaspirillum massiliense]
MTIHTRQAVLNDLDALAPLFDGYRQFYGQAPDLELARAFLHERLALMESVILLAEDDRHNALGFTQLYPSFSSVRARCIWILNDLFVAPHARAKGVGRALLEAARRHAIATGAIRLELSTAHDNPARSLYESLGYERDTAFCHYSLAL